jgi:hypothetical protein
MEISVPKKSFEFSQFYTFCLKMHCNSSSWCRQTSLSSQEIRQKAIILCPMHFTYILRRFETALLTPGPIQGISSRDGCYLAMCCLPLNITNRYFILREWVHQLQRPGVGKYRSRVSRKSIVGTTGWRARFRIVSASQVTLVMDSSIWVILEFAHLIVWSDWPPYFMVGPEARS